VDGGHALYDLRIAQLKARKIIKALPSILATDS